MNRWWVTEEQMVQVAQESDAAGVPATANRHGSATRRSTPVFSTGAAGVLASAIARMSALAANTAAGNPQIGKAFATLDER
jgi:hypothetical protein